MIVVLSDTHAAGPYELDGAVARSVREADLVVHAGDLASEAALDSLHEAADRLLAVHGNADDEAVRDRLPATRVIAHGGHRFVATHTRRGGETALRYVGRETGADVVIFGHTHRPRVEWTETALLLNPGSPECPRGAHPTYATLEASADGIEGAIRTTEGAPVASIAPEDRRDSGRRA